MNYLGISYEVKHLPQLDEAFIPFGVWMEAYRKGANKPLPSPSSATGAAFRCITPKFTARPSGPRPITGMWSGM